MLKLGIIQSATSWHDKQKNYQNIASQIAESDVDLIVLPEMFATGFTNEVDKCAETMDGQTVSWMLETAKNSNTALMGSVIIKEFDQDQSAKYFNRMIFVTPGGQVQTYDKRHLFRMGGEDKIFTGGSERKVFELNGVRIMPQICYDLRFPVWSRNNKEYDLLIYVACWPKPRAKAWQALLRARAIENQCFVVGVNMVGNDPYNEYSGNSAIIDFLGNTMCEVEDRQAMLTAEIDLESLNKFKEKFPAWMDADDYQITF